ncbi:hypothetical protein OBRU01_07899 [Operophtera brumata]|uniref:Uncharacterized protein n=1 Tax=Operophtera brumata TaxID=104452 RepID=A0A0L7LJB5_OPEBR|nr:hypothetical protein OBRU01_07899 [Operophtera brumata]
MLDQQGQGSDGVYGFERLSQREGSRPGRLGDLDQEYVSGSVIEYFLNEALLSVFQNDTYLSQVALMVSSECTQGKKITTISVISWTRGLRA